MDVLSVSVADGGDHIDHWREEIDRVDEQLVALINRRAGYSLAIGRVKARSGAATFQPERERQVVERLCSLNGGPLADGQVDAIWQAIMRASRELQTHGKIAFLGPAGTYSEDAVRAYFGEAAVPCPGTSIDEVFARFAGGEVEFAVVPIENSTEGAVNRSVDLLLDTNAPIKGEVVIPVRHCLLSTGRSLSGVTRVFGHPQSLAQCRDWLERMLPGVTRQEAPSNAEAARLAAAAPDSAAIAAAHAAAIYGLRVVAEDIQDHADNCTRFLVLGHAPTAATGFDRTTLAVYLDHQPGALADLLAPFGRRGVSVLWVDARPRRTKPWRYRFLLDVAGHRDDPQLAAALDELGTVAESYRVLGSYPRFDSAFVTVDALRPATTAGDLS